MSIHGPLAVGADRFHDLLARIMLAVEGILRQVVLAKLGPRDRLALRKRIDVRVQLRGLDGVIYRPGALAKGLGDDRYDLVAVDLAPLEVLILL